MLRRSGSLEQAGDSVMGMGEIMMISLGGWSNTYSDAAATISDSSECGSNDDDLSRRARKY